MFSVKLSPFKRLLMLALMFCVNTFYGARMSYAASLYSMYNYSDYIGYNYGGMGDYFACMNCCSANGGGYAVLGTMFSNIGNFGTMVYMRGVSIVSSACYCITTSVYQAMTGCVGMSCGALNTHGYGNGQGYYDLFEVISGEYNNCVPATDKCGCVAGFMPYNMISCVECSAGYYCSSTTSMWTNEGTRCSEGYYSDAGRAFCSSCPQGTYASGTGNASCTPCSRGYYNSYYGQVSCTRCPVYESSALFFNGYTQATMIIPGVFYADTESSGAQGLGYCYLPVISVGTIYSSFLHFQGFRGTNGQMIQEGSCEYE